MIGNVWSLVYSFAVVKKMFSQVLHEMQMEFLKNISTSNFVVYEADDKTTDGPNIHWATMGLRSM